ncbi:MAG: hypothetical protein ACPGKS_05375 [Coraliomargarita sp.]
MTRSLTGILRLLLICTAHALHAAEDAESIAQKIAANSGVANWEAIRLVKFTFSAEVPAKDKSIRRTWLWSPRSGTVQYVDADYTYNRNILNAADKARDAMFVNDSFWLLFPFNLVWTDDLELTLADGPVESPIAGTPLGMLTVQFPNEGGYTPGDAYDVFFDADYRIQEWIFRKGGRPEPSLISTWEDYQEFSGIAIATDHQGPGGFRLQMTDILID